MLKNSIIFILLLFFESCLNSNLDKGSYLKYILDEEHNLVKKIDLENMEYTILYRPYDMLILQEVDSLTPSMLKIREDELSGTLNFIVKIKSKIGNTPPLKAGITSIEEYSARYNYFLNNAKNDIHIEYKGAHLQPTYYSFETNYGLTPEDRMVIQFVLPNDEKEPSEDVVLKIIDKVYQNGVIKTTYDKHSLTHIPKLKL